MAYQAIYRKWRPQVFEDIIGQSHITNTLKNQIINDRISHAYLFCGTRGTGKTTAAKVLSKAVNCKNPVGGSPCNECEICRGINDGSILDVTEIDAASNNGVDNIREIREDVNFVATQAKYRVYIIDEVHMLSTGAFNALLKTLEDPPAHVIFILATTEVHKIPETILSRCQRFDFKRITPSDIIVRMKEIATADGFEISDEAYALLAQLADGSMRDGLSILERCISACGSKIDRDDITNVLGMVDNEMIFKIADAVISMDSVAVMEQIEILSRQGRNLNVFCDSLIKHFRDLLVCKLSQNPGGLLDYSEDTLVKLSSRAKNATYEKLSNAAGVLTKAKSDARWVKNPRIIYELALLKLTRPELDNSQEALLDRLSAVEEKAQNTVIVAEAPKEKKTEEKPKKKDEVSARLYVPIDASKLSADSQIVKIARGWDKIASAMVKKCNYIIACVGNRKVNIDGEGILLLFGENEIVSKNLAVKYSQELQSTFKQVSGTDYKIKPVFEKDVEDALIDFWNLPNSDAKAQNEEKPVVTTAEKNSNDPLDSLGENYPEIIEISADSDNSQNDNHDNQVGLTEDDFEDEKEEFLEESELSSDMEE